MKAADYPHQQVLLKHSEQITLCQEDVILLEKALQHLEFAFSEVRQREQYSATQIKRILAHSVRCKLEEARMIQKIASLENVVTAMKEHGSRAAEEREGARLKLESLQDNERQSQAREAEFAGDWILCGGKSKRDSKLQYADRVPHCKYCIRRM